MTDSHATHALTLNSLRSDVAEILEEDPASIADDENLAERGLDSIRLMSLTERWRATGAEVAFLELIETPTIDAWWARIGG